MVDIIDMTSIIENMVRYCWSYDYHMVIIPKKRYDMVVYWSSYDSYIARIPNKNIHDMVIY